MSVALLITSKIDKEQRELIPVAAQKIFTSKWLPGCAALKLEWVPLFETGISIDASNALAVTAELHLLHRWMIAQPGYEYEVERISRLIDELAKNGIQPDLDIFVG